MELGIDGKVAVVTGGSKGIGRSISLRLANEGALVAVVARGEQAIAETVAQIHGAGGKAIGISADLAELASYNHVIDEVCRKLGPPEIAVYNMETPLPGSFEEHDEAAFAYAFHIIVLCYMRMVKCVLPHMKQQGWGRIVTIGSGAAKQPVRGNLDFAYALTNTVRVAALGMAKTVAWETAQHGITVNTIATGAIETRAALDWFADRARERGISPEAFVAGVVGQIPVGRLGLPEEMAGLCAYLCSDIAAYTTGEAILCDGGLTNAMP